MSGLGANVFVVWQYLKVHRW